jgi:hypothetical protein
LESFFQLKYSNDKLLSQIEQGSPRGKKYKGVCEKDNHPVKRRNKNIVNTSNELREWSSSDELPRGFAKWLNDVVREQEKEKGFRKTADEFGVAPSILSRWLAGMGPLNLNDIQKLAAKLGPVVYTFLGIPRPDDTE